MQNIDPHTWWQLHLRKAKGETLSSAEQHAYDAELCRQDCEASPLKIDLIRLKYLRTQASELAKTNADFRSRVTELELEIQLVERSLSRETREALGVKE